MLRMSSLPRERIAVTNVCVGNHRGEPVYIHTFILNGEDMSKPPLVIVHGYGGSGALFYRVFEPLARHFRVYLFDVIGMGGSSRPDNFFP